MEWLVLLGIVIYLALSLVDDGIDAILYWLAQSPRAVLRALIAALVVGIISATWKGEVTATIYLTGILGGLVKLVFDWLKSHESA